MSEKYRWIVYLNHPMGGFRIERTTSIKAAKFALYAYDFGLYATPTATLYAYSEEAWEEAEEYREIGCPFDYPDKIMEFGPKGGIRVENA